MAERGGEVQVARLGAALTDELVGEGIQVEEVDADRRLFLEPGERGGDEPDQAPFKTVDYSTRTAGNIRSSFTRFLAGESEAPPPHGTLVSSAA